MRTNWSWYVWSSLISAAVPVGAALVGSLIGALGTKKNSSLASGLVHFAVGAFLGLSLFHLLPEAADQSGWTLALALCAVGWVISFLLARRVGGFCPACDSCSAPGSHHRLGAPVFWVIAFHSTLDGLPLSAPDQTLRSGALAAVAILFHKFPEGLAIAALARSGGRSVAASLGITAAIECCTFLGVAIGLAAGTGAGQWYGAVLALVAGSFLYLVCLTLSGTRTGDHRGFHYAAAALGFSLFLVAHLTLGP